jgi:hypothetical protein
MEPFALERAVGLGGKTWVVRSNPARELGVVVCKEEKTCPGVVVYVVVTPLLESIRAVRSNPAKVSFKVSTWRQRDSHVI